MDSGIKCVLFDWGNTVMRDFPDFRGQMYLWPRVEAIDGVADVIREVHEGRIIALASNAIDSQEPEIWKALKRVDLDQLFDRIYCFNKIGYMKPSARFFDYILKDLGLKRENLVMIGDDLERDVLGANNCGIYAIWFNERSDERRSTDMCDTIHKMSELPAALALRAESLAKETR